MKRLRCGPTSRAILHQGTQNFDQLRLINGFECSSFCNGVKRGFLGWIKQTIQLLWASRGYTEVIIYRNET